MRVGGSCLPAGEQAVVDKILRSEEWQRVEYRTSGHLEAWFFRYIPEQSFPWTWGNCSFDCEVALMRYGEDPVHMRFWIWWAQIGKGVGSWVIEYVGRRWCFR
jgi:hypothetical protein